MQEMSPEAVAMRRKMFGRFAKIQLLRRIYIRKAEMSNGLNCTQVHLLEYIREHKGCPQMDVAEALSISPAAVAMTVKSLKQMEYLTAAICPENQRCKQLVITPKGEAALESGCKIMDAFDASVFEGFSPKEMQLLAEFTNRMGRNMELALGREPIGVEPDDLQTLVKEIACAEAARNRK